MQPSRFDARCAHWVVAYFRSGWAFLIPYLAAYLLYAWLKWPVNVAAAGSTGHGARSWAPCLLHVYWALHAIQLVLGGFALRAWWSDSSVLRSPFSVLQNIAPWLCLALLFWIPGVYMEFPADPWTHYARVNEWHWHNYISEHSAANKSSYFIAYSLFGFMHRPAIELACNGFFYAACCLLLAFQYYRLACAAGLKKAPAFIFAAATCVVFGNNMYGFYRYYGSSSSIIAQIAVIACLRHAIEFAALLTPRPPDQLSDKPTPALAPKTIGRVLALASALAIIAFNHPQGLAMAGLGFIAVAGWAIVARYNKRGWLSLLGIGTVASLLAVALISAPSNTSTDPWFSPAGGFALFWPSSPAFKRSMEVLGAMGVVNLVAGLYLVRQNHIVGWLTVTPVVGLSLPCVAVPLAHYLSVTDALQMFNRLLLGIPVPMALVCLGAGLLGRLRGAFEIRPAPFVAAHAGLFSLVLALACAVAGPSSYPVFNRFYHALSKPQVGSPWLDTVAMGTLLDRVDPSHPFIGENNSLFVLGAHGYSALLYTSRDFKPSLEVPLLAQRIGQVGELQTKPIVFLVSPFAFVTPYSFASALSHHWPPQAEPADSAGFNELSNLAVHKGARREQSGHFVVFRFDAP